MIDENSWKQPIPTSITEVNNNPFARTIFQMILLRCANTTREVRTSRGPVLLNRGECLFGRSAWNELFGLPAGSQKIERELENSPFLNRYVNRRIESGKGSILKVKDYDSWVSMNSMLNTMQTRSEHEVNSNKSIKSVKSVKNKEHLKNEKHIRGELVNGEEVIDVDDL